MSTRQVVLARDHHRRRLGRADLEQLLVRGRVVGLEADDVLDVGELRRERAHPLLGGGAADEHHLGAAVVEDVLPFLVELVLVHRHVRRAEPLRGVTADHPLQAVVGDHRHAVLGPDAERGQAAAHVVDHLRELGVGDPFPAAVAAQSEKRARGIGGHRLVEHGDDVVVFRCERGAHGAGNMARKC